MRGIGAGPEAIAYRSRAALRVEDKPDLARERESILKWRRLIVRSLGALTAAARGCMAAIEAVEQSNLLLDRELPFWCAAFSFSAREASQLGTVLAHLAVRALSSGG